MSDPTSEAERWRNRGYQATPAVAPKTDYLGHNLATVERDTAWGEEHAGAAFPSVAQILNDTMAPLTIWNAADAVLNFPADTFEAGSDLFAEKVMEPLYEWQPSDSLPEMPDTGLPPMLNPAGMVKGFDLVKNLFFPLMSEDLDVIPGYDSEEMDVHPNTAMLVPFGGAAKKLIGSFGPAWRAAARLIGKGDDAPEILKAATSGPVFHGTNAEFETFERGGDLLSPGGGVLKINAAPNPDSGLGFHFSTDPNAAGVIGENVMERTIRLDNPLYLPRFSNAADLRYRAYVSEVGLDDIYEEGYQAYATNNGFTDFVNQGTPAERIMSGRGVRPGSDYGTNVESSYLDLFRTELNRVENIRLLVADHGMPIAKAEALNPYRAGSGVPDLSSVSDEVLEGWKSLTGVAGNRVGTGGPGDEVTRQWVKAQGYDGLLIEDAWMGNPEVDWASSRLGAPETGAPGQRSFVVFDADQIGTASARVADDAATDVVARIEDAYKAEGKDVFEYYRNLADASGYTDEIAIGQPERYGVRADDVFGGERRYFVPHHSNREDFLRWLQYKTEDLPDGDIHDLMRDINEYAQAKMFGDG